MENRQKPKIRRVDNNLGFSDGWITVKDSLGMSPQFHKKQLNIDEYRTSVVLKKEGNFFASDLDGRENILINPGVKDEISNNDKKFFTEIYKDNIRYDGLDLILDGLFASPFTKDLHLLITDTIVFKKGSPAYLVYNLPKGRRRLRFETHRHKLLLPILSTFFKKRKDSIMIDIEKEKKRLERENDFNLWRNKSRTNTAASRKSSMSEESIPNEGSFQLLNVFVDKNIQKKLSTEERSIRLKKRSIIRKLVERLYKNDPFLNSSKEKKRYFVSDFAYFKNKGDNEIKLLSENEFFRMMTERQNFEMWRKVTHLTSIFREKNKPLIIYRMKFDIIVYKDHQQYKKAKKYIQNLADNYKIFYVLEDIEYLKELVDLSPTEYCIYQVSKMIWFFEIFRKRSINKIMVDFSRTSAGDYYIMDIRNIQHSKARPENLDRYIVKKIKYREEGYMQKTHPEVDNFKPKEDELSAKVKNKVKILDTIYEGLKDEINLKLTMKEKIDKKPDKAFKKIHPDINATLTDIVEGKANTEKIIKKLKKMYYVDYRKKGPIKKFGVEKEELFQGKINEYFGKNFKKALETARTKKRKKMQKWFKKKEEKEIKMIDDYVNRHSKNHFNKNRRLPPLKDLVYTDPFQNSMKKSKSMFTLKRQTRSHKNLSKKLMDDVFAE